MYFNLEELALVPFERELRTTRTGMRLNVHLVDKDLRVF
jgi:hypothetical protein